MNLDRLVRSELQCFWDQGSRGRDGPELAPPVEAERYPHGLIALRLRALGLAREFRPPARRE
jgi:hypothetical protein